MVSSTGDPSKEEETCRAKVTCHCGKVGLQLANARPRWALECCCCDCRNAVTWSETKGTMGEQKKQLPASILYFDNDIMDVQGDSTQLAIMKLREQGSGSYRVYAKCCHSILFTIHALYFRNRIMVFKDVCNVEYEGEPVKPTTRIHTKFWDPERDGEIPPFEGEHVVASNDPFWPFRGGVLKNLVYPLSTSEGMSARALLTKLELDMSHPEVVVGLPERELEGHFQTGGGAFSLTLRNPFQKETP